MSSFYRNCIALGSGSFKGAKEVAPITPPPSSAEVANGLELYLCLPSVSAQGCHGETFIFTLPLHCDRAATDSQTDRHYHTYYCVQYKF